MSREGGVEAVVENLPSGLRRMFFFFPFSIEGVLSVNGERAVT